VTQNQQFPLGSDKMLQYRNTKPGTAKVHKPFNNRQSKTKRGKAERLGKDRVIPLSILPTSNP